MSARPEPEPDDEHQVTPLELFFDLVFVFALTQVTSMLADHPTSGGVLRGLLVVSAVWWAWTLYAWLTSTLAVDYLGPAVIGMGRGWRVAPEHFAERHGLIVIIALGESLIAIGVGAGLELGTGVLAGAALGIVVVSAFWWLYFDVAAIFARNRLIEARGVEQARLARDAYSYLHLPMIAGIVLFALGLKTTLAHVGDPLDVVPAVALCGGAALYLLAHIAFLYRTTGRVFRRRTIGAAVLLAVVPVATAVPALAALSLVSAACSLIVAYEAIRYREHRSRIRHPQPAR